MDTRSDLVMVIVEEEWRLFDRVKNVGKRAACQDDWETFRIMRKSQFMDWPEDLLESYLSDLREADGLGRNLITEKYGRMMESTSPEEYEKIKDYFPVRSDKRLADQERIISLNLKMDDEFSSAHPSYARRGRYSRSQEDSKYFTSKETYMRGEMTTWSDTTFYLYANWVQGLVDKGLNRSKMVAENVVREYGYPSVEDLERVIVGKGQE